MSQLRSGDLRMHRDHGGFSRPFVSRVESGYRVNRDDFDG